MQFTKHFCRISFVVFLLSFIIFAPVMAAEPVIFTSGAGEATITFESSSVNTTWFDVESFNWSNDNRTFRAGAQLTDHDFSFIARNLSGTSTPALSDIGFTVSRNADISIRDGIGITTRQYSPVNHTDLIKRINVATPIEINVERSRATPIWFTKINYTDSGFETIRVEYTMEESKQSEFNVLDSIITAVPYYQGIYEYHYSATEITFHMLGLSGQPLWHYLPDGSFQVLGGIYDLPIGESGVINATLDIPGGVVGSHLLISRTYRGEGTGLYCNDIISWSFRNGSITSDGYYADSCCRWGHCDEAQPSHGHECEACPPESVHPPSMGGSSCPIGVGVSAPHFGHDVTEHGSPGVCSAPSWGDRLELRGRGECTSCDECSCGRMTHSSECCDDEDCDCDDFGSTTTWSNDSNNKWRVKTRGVCSEHGTCVSSSMCVTLDSDYGNGTIDEAAIFASTFDDPIPIVTVKVYQNGYSIVLPCDTGDECNCDDKTSQENAIPGYDILLITWILGFTSILVIRKIQKTK